MAYVPFEVETVFSDTIHINLSLQTVGWTQMYVPACISSITGYIFNEPNKVQINMMQTNETPVLSPVFGDKQTQERKWYVSHGDDNEDKSVYFLMIILLCYYVEVISVFYMANI